MTEILSNDQIDQLLSAGGFSETSPAQGGSAPDSGSGIHRIFDTFCQEMSVVLRTVLNKDVATRVESCGTADAAVMKSELAEETLCVALPFKSGITGDLFLFVKKSDAAIMGDLMMMGEGNVPYGPEHDDALVELTNQIASSFVLAFNAEAGSAVAVDPAAIGSFSVDNPPEPLTSCDMVLIKLAIQGKPETSVIVLVPEKIGAQLSAKLAAKSSVSAGAVAPQGNSVDSFAPGIGNVVQEHASSPAKLQRSEGVEMLMDVDLDVSIELGRSMLSIKRILELAPGSIVELDRMAGEPVDLLVNNKVVAKGEVVVIDESFGIRILSLVSPEDRIKSLR